MKKIVKNIYMFLDTLGFNPIKLFYFFRGIPFYIRDYRHIKVQLKRNKDFKLGKLYPNLVDRFSSSGTMKGHYFHQDLLVARKIYENKPIKHIDIGSRIDGFVAHVAVFREIEIFDIRKQYSNVKNIVFKQADFMQIQDKFFEYCDSISSLHAIEHFGLGRYGDPVDINGHIKAINNIYSILKTNGKFYFSVPLGKQRIEFNAHRVFSIEYLIRIIKPKFRIDSFSYVDDNGNLHENVDYESDFAIANFNCNYGCAIFELAKL